DALNNLADLGTELVSFVAASPAVTSRSSTIALQAPAGTQAGDTLLCFMWSGETNDSNPDTVNLPSGWSLLSRLAELPHGQVGVLLRRVATANEPSSHTFALTSAASGFPTMGILVAYRGLDTIAAVVDAGLTLIPQVSPSATFTCPSLTL